MARDDLERCLPLVIGRERRELVRLLRCGGSTETTVDALLDALLRASGEEFDRRRDTQTAIRLCHVDLPTLAAQEIIDYDAPAGTVRYRPNERLEALLDSLEATTETRSGDGSVVDTSR